VGPQNQRQVVVEIVACLHLRRTLLRTMHEKGPLPRPTEVCGSLLLDRVHNRPHGYDMTHILLPPLHLGHGLSATCQSDGLFNTTRSDVLREGSVPSEPTVTSIIANTGSKLSALSWGIASTGTGSGGGVGHGLSRAGWGSCDTGGRW
jgi:hypothetical protein